MKKEIALLGGAFNPITKGHIQIAEYVRDNCKAINAVWLMPCYSHVYNKQMTESRHRLKMCEMAIKNREKIQVFDYEIKNNFDKGTYYVLQKLMSEQFSLDNINYSMIIGQDNANTIHNWIQYEKLIKLIRFIVIPRRGIFKDDNVDWYLKPPHIYLTAQCNIMEVSSTQVRSLIVKKQIHQASAYIDDDIIQYILNNKLYIE